VFVAAAVALLAARPAGAQVEGGRPKSPAPRPVGAPPRPPHPAGPLRVDEFAPASGSAGTHVTIKGTGFTRGTTVLVDGHGAAVQSWTPTRIVFAMPEFDGDAEIALRRPGMAGDVRVGRFRHIAGPRTGAVVRRLAPSSGPPGTIVELIGTGFQRAATVTMNGRPLAVSEWTPQRMVVTIPEAATTDFLLVRQPGGETVRSPLPFRVVARPPVIARFAPEGGPPGTRVRLSGAGFTPSDRVLYGTIPTPVLGRGPGWVDVEVPRRAWQSEPFQVRGPSGTARSEHPFSLDVSPVVIGFGPRHGPPGTQVDIMGRNFRDGDWVALAGKRLPIVEIRPRRISVTIPIGSESGNLVVGRDSDETTAPGRFDVLNPPSLTVFTPTRGEPGTLVTLTGSHLTGAEVFYGRERIPVRETQGDGSLVVEIPRAARDERFRVRTRAGTAEAPRVFQVQYYAVIEDATPRAGVPGATVVLRGRHLDKAEDFYIGSVRFELVARDNDSATCRVPEGARSAPVTWVSFGRRSETAWRFDVLAPPVILQFQPSSGPAGGEIIIRGDHIDQTTEVFFGRLPLRVVRVSPPGEIAVQLPRSAAGTDYLYLKGRGARARSEQTFEVKVAPLILSIAPAEAHPGDEVRIGGRWFTDATEILVGRIRARVLRRDREGGAILIEVPPDVPPGPHVLRAKSDALVSEYRRPLLVLPIASIESVFPARARRGQRIRVDGTALGSSVRIWFGSVELPIIRRSPSGKKVWVVVPDSARGTANLEVEEGGRRLRSSAQLTIDESKAEPVEARDRRHKPPPPR